MISRVLKMRECGGAYFIKDVDNTTLESFYFNILHNYKLILLCGLPSTGKTQFIQNYIARPNQTFTKWNRENIMSMIFNDGKRIEKMNKSIEVLESDILTEVLSQDFHQVLVDGWYLIPYHRKKILSYMSGGSSLCLVFDGDINDIVSRALSEGKLKIPKEEVEMFISNKADSTTWPSFSEGWNEIIYFCSFDSEESKKYMKNTLKKVKR